MSGDARMHPLDTVPLLVCKVIHKIHHFKYSGYIAICYLKHLFNLSFNHSDTPFIWKTKIVISSPKYNKPDGIGLRLILSPALEVFQRLLILLKPFYFAPTYDGLCTTRDNTTAILGLFHEEVNRLNKGG